MDEQEKEQRLDLLMAAINAEIPGVIIFVEDGYVITQDSDKFSQLISLITENNDFQWLMIEILDRPLRQV